jgi:hypothetical protein
MRVAVIFNRNSSFVNTLHAEIGRKLAIVLRHHQPIVHEDYGAGYLPDATNRILEARAEGADYKAMLRQAVLDMLALKPEFFITVGGDGLAAYVADVLITTGGAQRTYATVPIMGIAAGTANVGPIVSIRPDQLNGLDLKALKRIPAGAVQVQDGADVVGYGFNDVIIGNSLLTTIGGETENISVEELVTHDRKVVIRPGTRIAGVGFQVFLNGSPVAIDGYPQPLDIKQIVVTSLQFDRLYGRAIMGALVRGGYEEHVAAIGLSDRVIVDSAPAAGADQVFTTMRQLTFTEGDFVVLGGFAEDAHLVIDGNPYLRRHDELTFRYLPGLVTLCALPSAEKAGKNSLLRPSPTRQGGI